MSPYFIVSSPLFWSLFVGLAEVEEFGIISCSRARAGDNPSKGADGIFAGVNSTSAGGGSPPAFCSGVGISRNSSTGSIVFCRGAAGATPKAGPGGELWCLGSACSGRCSFQDWKIPFGPVLGNVVLESHPAEAGRDVCVDRLRESCINSGKNDSCPGLAARMISCELLPWYAEVDPPSAVFELKRLVFAYGCA